MSPILLSPAWLRSFRRKLLAWFARHARDLPWRRDNDPYAVWLSEIMLQQTQVATVKFYFERFLAALPTIEALASAEEQAVFRLWEGLGYYRRARLLHQAARMIVAEHGGVFPRDMETVRRLPGIGRYTAGAVLSIAFDQRHPILEANTQRLLSRLLAYDGDTSSTAARTLLWTTAETLLPAEHPGRFNQALMELGSEVCRPRAPRCEVCPVALHCAARERGLQAEIPRSKIKPPPEQVHEAAVFVRRRGRVLLIQWAEGRRWAGLWDFPRFPLHATREAEVQRELVEGVAALTGMTIRPGRLLKTLRHSVTRFRITLDCHEAQYVSAGASRNGDAVVAMEWLRPEELADYPLSSTGRELAALA